MSVDLTKGATVELVKTLSDDLRAKSDGTKWESAGAAIRAHDAEISNVMNDLSQLEYGIIDYNSVNSLAISGTFNDITANGITYTWVSKTECHVEGTATGNAFYNIFSSLSALPKGMILGNTVKVIFNTEQPISLEILAYLNNQTSGGVSTIFRNTGNYAIPVNCTGMVIRMRSRSTDPANGSIFLGIISAESNAELSAAVSVLENKATTTENAISTLNTENAIINSTLNAHTAAIYNIFENNSIEWTAGKQVNSNGSIGDNANTCAFSKYMYCPAGSKLSVSDGYLFNIAIYTSPISSAMTEYRGFENAPYFVTSDCYVNVSVANVTSGVPVTVEDAKNAFNGVVISQVKADEYKAEIQNIVNLNAIELESGTLNTDGTTADAANRMRSATGVFIKSGTTLINATGVSVNWRSYSDKECTKFYASGASFVTDNVAISRDNYYKFVLQKNNYLNGRLSQYFTINDNNTQENQDERLSSLEFSVQPLRGMPIIFPPSAPYTYSGTDITEAIINGSGNLLTPLYNLYDALEAAHPNHITKEVLGLDQSGQYEIRAYTIQQHQPPISKPVILWISGVHASETYTHTATYAFVKELLENHENNDVLGFIWRNCIFKVIPIGNPWGLANGASRYNSRGVNLNRNFNADWQYSEDEYNNSGSAPESEAETQAIVNFVKANGGAIFAVNKHDSGTDLSGSGSVAYSVDDFRIDTNVLRSVYAQMQMAILKKYTWIVQNRPAAEYTMMFSTLSTAKDHGTMDKWFSTVGMHGCLLEVSRPATTGYTADKQQDFIQMNLETSVNMVSAVLEKNQLMASSNALWYIYNVIE